MAQKRQEADYSRRGAFDMAQNFYTAPGLQALGNLPLSYQAGQQQLGLGLGAIGSAVPQMINPDAGANLGMQQRAQQVAAGGANAQAQAGYTSGIFQGLGAIGGGIAMASDLRLKEDINHVGFTQGGLPIYTYRYIGGKQKYRGVMAQDVLRKQPEAVIKDDSGYFAVDYSQIQ
jgi:hypothetical protein